MKSCQLKRFETLSLTCPSNAQKATRAKTIAVEQKYALSENMPKGILSDLENLKLFWK